jgi:hypothetical protein
LPSRPSSKDGQSIRAERHRHRGRAAIGAAGAGPRTFASSRIANSSPRAAKAIAVTKADRKPLVCATDEIGMDDWAGSLRR